jgi:hypothetical protein
MWLFCQLAASGRKEPKHGTEIKYFHTACITDNSVEAVLLPDAAE